MSRTQPSVTLLRLELIRQRDLLLWGSGWMAWGLPLWPGMSLMLLGGVLANPANWPWILSHAVLAVVFGLFIARQNRRGADRVQRVIDALDS